MLNTEKHIHLNITIYINRIWVEVSTFLLQSILSNGKQIGAALAAPTLEKYFIDYHNDSYQEPNKNPRSYRRKMTFSRFFRLDSSTAGTAAILIFIDQIDHLSFWFVLAIKLSEQQTVLHQKHS